MAIDEDYDRWDVQEVIDLRADYEFACEMDREIRTAQIERQNTTCDEASYGVLRPVMEECMVGDEPIPPVSESTVVAVDAVASALEIMSYVPPSMLTRDQMGEVFYMLAKVLRHPEILS